MAMPRYTVVIDTEGKEHLYKLATKKCGDCRYFVDGSSWCEFGEISCQKLNEACGDWKVRLPIPEVDIFDEADHFTPVLEETNHGDDIGDDDVPEELAGHDQEAGGDIL